MIAGIFPCRRGACLESIYSGELPVWRWGNKVVQVNCRPGPDRGGYPSVKNLTAMLVQK